MSLPEYWPEEGWSEGLENSAVKKRFDKKLPSLRDGDNSLADWDWWIRAQIMKELDECGKFWTVELARESDAFRAVISYLDAAVAASPYVTQPFEAIRLAEPDQKVHKGTVAKYLVSKLPGTAQVQRPAFTTGSYQVTRMKVIFSPARWNKYLAYKNEHGLDLDALKQIEWVSRNVKEGTFSFPLIEATGECFLLHGTKSSTIKLIAENGFGPEYCNDRGTLKGGYGSLGQGSYLSDNLAKIATYASCPVCATSGGPCDCMDGNNKPIERMAIIARAFIPANSKVTTKKKLAYINKPLTHKPDRPLVIGLASKPGTSWPNNVFLVRHKDMVYPEMIVYFQWPRAGFAPTI